MNRGETNTGTHKLGPGLHEQGPGQCKWQHAWQHELGNGTDKPVGVNVPTHTLTHHKGT